jgi:hypothetical protein
MRRNAAEVAREAARGLMFIFKRVDSLVERCAWCLLSTERGLMLIFDSYLEEEPSPPPPPDEWDPAGDAPPPVELPDGMRWRHEDAYGEPDWDVWCIAQDRRAGYVTPTSDRWLVKTKFKDFHCDTALEACRALAKELKKERDHE